MYKMSTETSLWILSSSSGLQQRS